MVLSFELIIDLLDGSSCYVSLALGCGRGRKKQKPTALKFPKLDIN